MENKINVYEVYHTFMGEQNIYGIGAPVIFLRLGGCHIRCYKKTLGTLCDTPHVLTKGCGTDKTVLEIVNWLKEVRARTGINLICVSGGEPLFRDKDSLIELFNALLFHFNVVVETSGIDYKVSPFLIECKHNKNRLSFVIDYKGHSAGIPNYDKRGILYDEEELKSLDKFQTIKFVIYDDKDYTQFKRKLADFRKVNKKVRIVVGPFWCGEIPLIELSDRLAKDKLYRHVALNMQAHKLALTQEVVLKVGNDLNFDKIQI